MDGARQIVIPATVSLLCICIVFVPMFGLGGVAGYLFRPLAEAVVFALIASYVLSRTLVPTTGELSARRSGARARAAGEPHAPGQPQSADALPARLRAAFRAGARTAIAACWQPRCAAPRRSSSASCARGCCRSAWCRSWARISFRRSRPGRSSCMCARRPARASRRPRGCATESRRRSARIIPPRRSRHHRRQYRPADQRHQHGLRQLRHHRRSAMPTS